MKLEKLRKLNLPKSPGIYQFFNKAGKIIYIGKASNLRSRVLSYWSKSADHAPAKQEMLKQIKALKWIETDTQIEAMLLEANLIKKYQPYYNIVLRDDKRFTYIKISTEDEWPRIFMTRKLDKSGKYFGPFTSTEAIRETLKIIRKIWPYRSCKNLPKRACLYYRINKCPGMCEKRITIKEYKNTIRQIDLFLQGKKKLIIRKLEARSRKLEKEIKKIKDKSKAHNDLIKEKDFFDYQLNNINRVLEHSRIISIGEKYAADVIELAKSLQLRIVPRRIEGYDISNIFGKLAVGSMVVFQGGEPNKNEYRKFKIKIGQGQANDIKMLKEVLERRFKRIDKSNKFLPLAKRKVRRGSKKINSARPHPVPPLSKGRELDDREKNSWPTPDLIIVDGGKAQLNASLSILKKVNLDIPVITVSKGAGLRSSVARDKIFFPGQKQALELPLASPALHLIKRVRDEAHRFAISYHRLLRKKVMMK